MLGGGALLDFFGGKSAQNMSEQQFQAQLEQSGEQFDRRMDHANYWAHRGDQWAGTDHNVGERNTKLGHLSGERDKRLSYGMARARREDFRPYAQTGVAALGKMTSALGIQPEGGLAPAFGGDQHIEDWEGVDWEGVDAPRTLGDLPKTGAGSTTGSAPHVATRNADGTVTLTYPDGTSEVMDETDPRLTGVKERVT